MLLYHDGRRYVCKSLYTERELPKSAGFRWDPLLKVWWTDKDANAWKLIGYADTATKLLLKRSIKDQSKSLSLSRAVDANVEIPAPDGLRYLPFQKAGIAYALSRPAVLIGDEMGLGKDQPLYSKILTPNGWTTMGEIKVGDEVIGSEGLPHIVTGVFPQGRKIVYRIWFSDGEFVDCGLDHLWNVIHPNSKFGGCKYKTLPLREILKTPLHYASGNARYYLPTVSPITLKEKVQVLHPYLLGVLLGDGCLHNPTPSLSSISKELLNEVSILLPQNYELRRISQSNYDYRIVHSDLVPRTSPNIVRAALADLGVNVKSNRKFIPDLYKFGSLKQRVALFQGLMDTDGWAQASSSKSFGLFYTSVSELLCDDVRFLVESFGGVARKSSRIRSFTYKGEKKKGQRSYTLTISLPREVSPFRCVKEKKLDRFKPRIKYLPVRAIKKVEKIGFRKTQCILVDASDGLYVTDHCVLTHNTIEAIGVINAGSKPERVLIICPASLKGNWAREFAKWTTHRLSIGIATSKEPWPPDHVVIVNYDILDRFEKEIAGTVFDYLIVDECHYVKNSNTKRAAHVLGRAKKGARPAVDPIKARKRMFMSGTPIVNRPKELWPIIHSLDPKRWTSFFKYAMRYCGAYHNGWGWDFSGSSNLGELQEILRSTVLVRRLKSEVLKELPDKVRQVIELPANGAKKLIEAEWEKWREHKDKVEELQKRIEDAAVLKDVGAYREAVQALRSEMVIAFSSMAQVRHDTAVAKIPMVVEHLTNVLESGNKVVVFAHHHDVVDALAKEFEGSCVVVDGRVPPGRRIELVDAFQMNPKMNLFIGSITAAGVGITLTAASHVIFAELDWVPGNVSQAEDRLHRIGQKDSVLVQHLVLEDSLDAHMAKVIVKKQEVIEKALDKEAIAVPREKTKKDLLNYIDRETSFRKEEKELTDKADAQKRKNLASTPTWYSSSDVLEALRILAERCDGARSLDGNGFNKFDTAFGKDLASRNFLTPGQTEAGIKLVRKYRKQLPERIQEKLNLVQKAGV